LKNDLLKYFCGKKVSFTKYKINYDNLSDFGKKVLKNTRLIPFGNTKSYSQIAEDTGNPKACRAVGNALNKNPVPVIIPCHRVIQKNGKLGGFSGGTRWKYILLLLENNNLSIDKKNDNMLKSN
jgi:methylated-DNA-[protein]-cysteine S-methyltransferase